jgi:hypothetical protein
MLKTDLEYPFETGIREQMEILTADGEHLGRVLDIHTADRIGVYGCLAGAAGKVEIPLKWIAWVDETVHLTKTRKQIVSSWRSSREPGHQFSTA